MAKPSSHINWTDGSASYVQAPSAGRQTTGYTPGDRPPAKEHNWIFNLIDQWNKYFETTTDTIVGQLLAYDAVVGAASGATHATLQLAINAASAGWRILVLDSATINTKVSVTKSDIEIQFKPGVVYTKGSDTIALEVTGSRVVIRGGRFVGYTVAGNIAIKLLLGADYCQIRESMFAVSTDTEVSDSAVAAGKKPMIDTITEV